MYSLYVESIKTLLNHLRLWVFLRAISLYTFIFIFCLFWLSSATKLQSIWLISAAGYFFSLLWLLCLAIDTNNFRDELFPMTATDYYFYFYLDLSSSSLISRKVKIFVADSHLLCLVYGFKDCLETSIGSLLRWPSSQEWNFLKSAMVEGVLILDPIALR